MNLTPIGDGHLARYASHTARALIALIGFRTIVVSVVVFDDEEGQPARVHGVGIANSTELPSDKSLEAVEGALEGTRTLLADLRPHHAPPAQPSAQVISMTERVGKYTAREIADELRVELGMRIKVWGRPDDLPQDRKVRLEKLCQAIREYEAAAGPKEPNPQSDMFGEGSA